MQLNMIISLQTLQNVQLSNYLMQKIFGLLNENNFPLNKDLINVSHKDDSESLFLKKKRNFDTYIFQKKWNNIFPKKEVNFSIEREKEKKIETSNSFTASDTLSKMYSYLEKSGINDIKNSNNDFQNSDKIEHLFKILINLYGQNHSIELEESKNKNDLNIQQRNDSFGNEKLNLNDNSIKTGQLKNIIKKENNLFKVMNLNNVDNKKEVNNKVGKIMINNKYVYANPNEIDLFPYSNMYRKSKKIIFVGVGKRSSKYRGVSKNGNQWQVLIMVNKSKTYIGTYSSEIIAARIYDIIAIKNRRIKARTNFVYSKNQIKNICSNDIDINAKNINEVILKTRFRGLDLLPSSLQLAGIDIELLDKGREDPNFQKSYQLKKSIDLVSDNYDYIIVDCPPSLGLITTNALTASDSVIIPVQCEFFALEGITQLLNAIMLTKKKLNPNLKLEGVLLTMFDSRANLSIEVIEEIRSYFKDKVYTTLIPRLVRLAEAPSHGKPIIAYDPKSKGSLAYLNLAKEVIEKNGNA